MPQRRLTRPCAQAASRRSRPHALSPPSLPPGHGARRRLPIRRTNAATPTDPHPTDQFSDPPGAMPNCPTPGRLGATDRLHPQPPPDQTTGSGPGPATDTQRGNAREAELLHLRFATLELGAPPPPPTSASLSLARAPHPTRPPLDRPRSAARPAAWPGTPRDSPTMSEDLGPTRRPVRPRLRRRRTWLQNSAERTAISTRTISYPGEPSEIRRCSEFAPKMYRSCTKVELGT